MGGCMRQRMEGGVVVARERVHLKLGERKQKGEKIRFPPAREEVRSKSFGEGDAWPRNNG